MVCLVPARTDTKWFAIIWEYARLIIFLQGRLKFVGAESSAPFPSALAIFSPEPIVQRHPGLLNAVADRGFVVDPTVLRSRRAPDPALDAPSHVEHDQAHCAEPAHTELAQAVSAVLKTFPGAKFLGVQPGPPDLQLPPDQATLAITQRGYKGANRS